MLYTPGADFFGFLPEKCGLSGIFDECYFKFGKLSFRSERDGKTLTERPGQAAKFVKYIAFTQ